MDSDDEEMRFVGAQYVKVYLNHPRLIFFEKDLMIPQTGLGRYVLKLWPT